MRAVRDTVRRTSRMIAFARYIPVRKLLRRSELSARHRLRDWLGARPAAPRQCPVRLHALPQPLFPRRPSGLPADGGTLYFTFLHRTVAMPEAAIDWNAPSLAPADQLWRMNLHYMEYLEGAGDAQFGRLAFAWIAANPRGRPGSWQDSWNSYALSLRVVVLMQELVRRRETLAAAVAERIEASLVEQLEFLERNLETDLGGNHLIKNIKALICASAYFEGPEAARWRETGLGLLTGELGRQVLPDGMHYERSASYHAQVFADLMECRQALGEDPLGGKLDGALARMAQVTADLAHPDGGPVLFNDAGLTMAYAPEQCLSVYERLTGRRPEPRNVFALADGGYFGLRTPEQYLLADCGRIAPDDLPAHGHGDVLAFEWSVKGERLIVDQGVFEYNAGGRRARARAAASHNTLSFDGADQADFFGSFRCGRRPNVTVRHYEPCAGGFALEGSHDGYSHLPGAPIHVRRYEAGPGGVRIADRIEGVPKVAARIGFLLHPEVTAAVEGSRALLTHGEARAEVRCSKPLSIEDAVWWPGMGCELPTRRLSTKLIPGEFIVETSLEIL